MSRGIIKSIVFGLSLFLLLLSFWHRNDFQPDLQLEAELEKSPLQAAISKAPFTVEMNQVHYQIKPLFDYTLYGLVVSYSHHDGDTMLHKLWNDHLNTSDVCVVWSNTALDLDLNEYNFWNGQFTCNIKTSNSAAWARFDMTQLSNNHLLSDDKILRGKIRDISVGDQIYIKGWLSEYASEGALNRVQALFATTPASVPAKLFLLPSLKYSVLVQTSGENSCTCHSFYFLAQLPIIFFHPTGHDRSMTLSCYDL